MAAARVIDVVEEETRKMKENAIALIITSAIILKQLLRLSEYCRLRLGVYSLRLRGITVKYLYHTKIA